MPTRSPCIRPKNVKTAPAAANAAAARSFRSMMKTVAAPEHDAGERGAAAQHLQAVQQHALVGERRRQLGRSRDIWRRPARR